VNCIPSLRCDSSFNAPLKISVIRGTLRILDLSPVSNELSNKDIKQFSKKMIEITNVSLPPISDPMNESEIARTTHWRQLFPCEYEITKDEKKTITMQSNVQKNLQFE
jgi:hypothetical protein